MAFSITPLTDHTGAEVVGIDFTQPIDSETKTSLNDAWIHTKITSKLISDKDTPARKINIDVVDGIVTLRGEVNSAAAKSEAK